MNNKVARCAMAIQKMNPSELRDLRDLLGDTFDLPPNAGVREPRPSRPPDREYSALAEKMEEQALEEL